ncbi:M13 family metallopeptidase [Phenylobacterium sp.]|uniref:M13 family metallopeptidase n=1 Tax=Phenylobacterium sp. TaxID=1871053 RepID=UPI0026090E27|nr:M13 family metallopeptidase [Phenylobacterium sp.]
MRRSSWLGVALAMSLAAGGVKAASAPAAGTTGIDPGNIDHNVRPGDDFWGYVNGGWARGQAIPPDRSYWGDAARLREQSAARVRGILEGAKAATPEARKMGAFYAAYMDEAAIEAKGIAPLRPDLARIAALRTPADIARFMADFERRQPLTAAIGAQSVFPISPGVGADLKDPTRNTFGLSQGGLGLPDRDYYLSTDPKMAAAREAYRVYLARLFTLTGFGQPQARADRVMAFEADLAKGHWARADLRDFDKTYNPMTEARLAASAPGFDWSGYLLKLGVPGINPIIVGQPTAMTAFAKLAAATPVQTWRDYLVAHVANAEAPYLTKAFVDADFEFHGKALSGVPELRARWKRAVDLMNLCMGDAIGREYVRRYFPPQAKAQIEAMIGEIKTAFAHRIDRLTWMAPETKLRAMAKLAALKVEVGYPDKWRSYAGLQILPGDLYGDVSRSGAFEQAYQFGKLKHPVDRSAWGFTTEPQTVNAFNYGNLLKLAFPAGYLAPPYFDPAADPAVNYGGIGSTIGHEISHSFDDQGAKLDERGRLITWWTPADAAAFKASTTALADQFSAYEPLAGVHENGRLTLGENTGDLGGLVAALDAYHASLKGRTAPVIDGLTGDQRFFIAYAQAHRWIYRENFLRQVLATDPHGADPYRADTVRNVDAWYAAFDVKPGDKLYLAPDQRVRIW